MQLSLERELVNWHTRTTAFGAHGRFALVLRRVSALHERDPDGKRVYRRRVIGTVEQYPDEDAARGAVAVLVSEIKSRQPLMAVNPLTVAQLADHFEHRELGSDNNWRSHATKKTKVTAAVRTELSRPEARRKTKIFYR